MTEIFPAIKCFAYEKLHLLNPRIVAYIHALIINSISVKFDETNKSQALQHEATMLDVYSGMNPDNFKSQLQAVLTTFYEDIKGHQGASGCPKPKTMKRRFQDMDETGLSPAVDAACEGSAALDDATRDDATPDDAAPATAAPAAAAADDALEEEPAAAAAAAPGKGTKRRGGKGGG